MQNPVGKIYTHCIYIILLILFNNVQNGLTQLNPYFQFIPQNDNLHTKIYDYSEGFDEDSFTYELQYPIPIYETLIKKITIRKNGLLALDSISGDNLPSAYPVNTSITNQRLQDFDGRYLSIFSSVNDGKSGRIRVTEIDLLSPSKLPCVERMQIDRLIKFIHLSYIEEAELKAQYIVHILWENMTNAYLINQKANTYGMTIISNGIRSYAFMQYIQVEWNENDVAENLALPPESGIFMRPLGGYQLPRSSQAVEPNIWLTETNIALHGEWLVPLYKSENIATINVKNLSAVASEFVASLASICKGSLHSLKSNNETPSDTVVIKNVNTENTSEEPIARTHSFKRALENLENYDLNVSTNDYSNGITENVPKAAWNILRDEAEISGDDPFNQNEVNILPENETGNSFYHESNKFVVDNKEHTYTDTITAQTYYPLGRYDGDEERQEIHEPLIVPVTIHPLSDDDDDEVLIGNNGEYKSMNETFSNDLVKCDAVSECNSHNTECYRVDNAACCICSDGFFGAGNAKCWSEVNDHKFSFSGSLTARFGSEHSSSPLHIYLDIQHGSLRRSSSGIRGGQTNDRIYSTIRLITPVFHILNSMISSPCENIPKRERVYNLFTLGNGLQRPFKVLFQFDIERVGKFTIQAILELRDFTTGAYASGVIELEAFSTENLNLLDRSYIEAYSASDKPDKTYYANYKIDDHGRIVFPEQTVKFIVEHRDSNEISNFPEEINVHWSAVAESESCLLKQVSSIPKNEWYYIRLKDRGYCSEDCSAPDGSCNLFCVDEPLLLATEPSPCDCVTCDRHGEVCRPEGASYRCECGQGLKLMPDNTCQATSLVDVANYLGVQCGSVNCHTHARCIDPNQAFCQCLPGYRGDGVSHCENDPCSKCRRNEICENGICIASGVDLCEGVQCGEQAFCQDGACVCTPGYTGDPVVKCYEERELCAGVQCHRFGQCYENRCYCSHGYVGDGVNFCDARANDPCDGVRCAANGRCQDGRCVCDPGYTGDGYNECREAEGVNLCGNVQCHQYATCDRGQCRCVTGYDGDGYSDCRPVTEDKCSRVRCHPDAQCTDGYCFCPSGFEGDGYYECKRITQDPCARIRCHPQAQCEYGFCRCKNGYKGDGYWNCQPIQSDLCRAEQCHQFARCVEGRCRCLDGYEGDGYQMCNIIPGATSADCGNCNGIPFKELAQCVGGRCICARGFIEVQPGVCMECVQDNCHQDAVCRPDERFNGAYSCHCKAGFTGDGVSVCKPESVGREDATSSHTIDPTCGGGCRTRNAECDRYTGTCKCRSGYDGDGERGCYWNCKLCHSSAICDRENERCICPSGYRGDGQTFCERIPVRQDSIKVLIMGEGEVMHITDISHPLELRCFVTGSDQSYSGQWIKPHSAQEPIVTKTRQQDGYEISLLINQPTITDSGRYECRAGNVAAFIDVNVEESAIPFTVLLTSDDGILMTQSTDSNVTKATLWNIAENNKYGRVSMVGDCNSQRIIYTSDYGHTIRWGNSNSGQNKLVTKEIYTSQFNRFRNLAVDSLSGNVFAWEEAFGKIMVFNPNKPNIHYTLESLHSLTSSEQQNFAGLALHSTLGLMYWAIYTDGWRPNGTIQVASMSGENEEQLLQLTGEPLAISISPATPVNGNSAGKLCWMQRSSKGMFGLVTELHCARLGQTGREILTNEKIREFSPSEEPSFGMTQYKGTLLWTDATKTVYYSINPDRRIRVRYVCCSNRFQALSVLGDCPQASTNPCTYSNGRCRYICLPNDGGRSRTCVCPDNEPGCHKEM
ncbi:egf-like domain protein [Schistosoma mansoni]|uniref:egf-like domain protein n=1 Tax=Schistosoma mansoni TaxID=6183 RepID=UPI00022DBED6|nr:egf-like domain protein [Schistosoma mansoni]|eukprot:XP_018649203.1 egf-like domain protein [Schistosoma mansoni]